MISKELKEFFNTFNTYMLKEVFEAYIKLKYNVKDITECDFLTIKLESEIFTQKALLKTFNTTDMQDTVNFAYFMNRIFQMVLENIENKKECPNINSCEFNCFSSDKCH